FRRSHLHPRGGWVAGGVVNLERGEVVCLGLLPDLIGHDRLEVERGHALLLVRYLLEALEGGVERLSVDAHAQLFDRVSKRAPAVKPAKELATARPRSSWQCTETTMSRSSGTRR